MLWRCLDREAWRLFCHGRPHKGKFLDRDIKKYKKHKENTPTPLLSPLNHMTLISNWRISTSATCNKAHYHLGGNVPQIVNQDNMSPDLRIQICWWLCGQFLIWAVWLPMWWVSMWLYYQICHRNMCLQFE